MVRLAREVDRAAHDVAHIGDTVDVHYVDYKLAARNGAQTSGVLNVSGTDVDHVKVGADTPVVLHPDKPAVRRLPSYSEPVIDNGSGGMMFLSGMMVLIGAWFVGYGWRLARKVAAHSPTPVDRGRAFVDRAVELPQQAPVTRKAAAGPRAGRRQGFGQRARLTAMAFDAPRALCGQ